MGEYREVDNELNNCPDFGYSSNVSTGLLKQLIPTISMGFIPDTVTFCSLDIISSNGDFKIVYNQIYLLLPLN